VIARSAQLRFHGRLAPPRRRIPFACWFAKLPGQFGFSIDYTGSAVEYTSPEALERQVMAIAGAE
jgi:hypothetical protein